MREKLTVIVPTYNEEKNIEACLKSLTFADEIIVVDSFSTDKTKDIALKFTDNFEISSLWCSIRLGPSGALIITGLSPLVSKILILP